MCDRDNGGGSKKEMYWEACEVFCVWPKNPSTC